MTGSERAIEWRHAEMAAVCDSVERWAHGVVATASDIPDFWQFNQVRVEGDPGFEAEQLAEIADGLLGRFAHRYMEIDDEAYAERVRPGFEALGWIVNRGVVMRLEGDLPAAGAPVREGHEDEIRPLRREWHLSEPWSGGNARQVESFLAAEDILNDRRSTRLLVTDAPDGSPAGYVRIRGDAGGGEIHEAYCRPQFRGKGLGGGLVAAGAAELRARGAEDIYIVADDEDRPKRLYARIGFAPVRVLHELMRVPPA